MKIKKVSSLLSPLAKVLNIFSLSQADTYSCDYINKLNEYSTEEQVIGKWIDGKPLYRKVISSNFASTVNSQKTIGTIKDFNVIVKFEGYFINPTNDRFYPFPFALNDEDISVNFYKVTGEIFEVHNYSYANNLYCYAVVEYTKTTD